MSRVTLQLTSLELAAAVAPLRIVRHVDDAVVDVDVDDVLLLLPSSAKNGSTAYVTETLSNSSIK
jgi:hypothetical protein